MREKLAAAVAEKFIQREPIPEEELEKELEFFGAEDDGIDSGTNVQDLSDGILNDSDGENDDDEMPTFVFEESSELLTGVRLGLSDNDKNNLPDEINLPLFSYANKHGRSETAVPNDEVLPEIDGNLSQVSLIYCNIFLPNKYWCKKMNKSV
jgi:hypothetical protein